MSHSARQILQRIEITRFNPHIQSMKLKSLLFSKVILTALLFSSTSIAQGLPERSNLRVNDLIDMIPADEEARLTAQLNAVADELGTDMTLLAIGRRSDHSNAPTIEAFATNLFNLWGVGSVENNSGILIILARDDREMRIELGADYPPIYDEITENVIDNSFLPHFRDEDYATGIARGVDQSIARIARPFALGEEVRSPEDEAFDTALWLVLGGAGIAVIGGIVGYRRRKTCPQCGELSLKRQTTTVVSASRSSRGQGKLHRHCPNCGFDDTSFYVIPMITNSSSSFGGSSGGSSGGGFSSGGGGSGRW